MLVLISKTKSMKKILLILGLFLSIGVFGQIGFTYFDTIPSATPTTQELIASLSGAQKAAIINGFAEGTRPIVLKHDNGIATAVTAYFYAFLRQIGETADQLMAASDLTEVQLKSQIYTAFSADFTEPQINAAIDKRIEYSKHDGTGDWNYYKAYFGW